MRAFDPAYCHQADPLTDDEVIDVDGLRLQVVLTPGHTEDSISLLLPAERTLLTGDMVLGRGTTVIAWPDGHLGSYFESIERMRDLAASGAVETLWPAHGPVLDDALGTLDHYLVHRRQRLAQVESALEQLGIAVARPGGRGAARARSSRSSTRTSTSRSGARPSGRSEPSWRTSPAR